VQVSALVNRVSLFTAIGNLATGRQTPASEHYTNALLLSNGCSRAYPSHFSPVRLLHSRSEFEIAEAMYSHVKTQQSFPHIVFTASYKTFSSPDHLASNDLIIMNNQKGCGCNSSWFDLRYCTSFVWGVQGRPRKTLG
jgi:hypothetical protein